MNTTTRLLGAALAIAALMASAGCVRVAIPVPESVSDTDRIEMDDAESLSATIEMGAGQLTVTGGTDALMDADFRFTDSAWRPVVNYEVRDGEGRLRLLRKLLREELDELVVNRVAADAGLGERRERVREALADGDERELECRRAEVDDELRAVRADVLRGRVGRRGDDSCASFLEQLEDFDAGICSCLL